MNRPDDAPTPAAASGGRTGPAHLTTAECWELLEHASLGRLAVTDSTGMPDVYPINFRAHEGAVYLRTARDTKLARITARPMAALEVDGEDEDSRWSVVLRGDAEQVRNEQEIHRSGVLLVQSASPKFKPYVIKLTPRSVTGRRFSRRPPDAAPPRHVGREEQPPIPVTAQPDAHVPRHPEPIPHRPPLETRDTGAHPLPPESAEPDPLVE